MTGFRDVSAEWASKMTGALWLKAKATHGTREERLAAYEVALLQFEQTEAYKRLQAHRLTFVQPYEITRGDK